MPRMFKAAWWRALLGHEGKRRILGNIGWLTGEWVVLKATLLVSSVILARYLGPSDFGRFGYSLSIVMLFLPLASLGLTSIVVRDLVQRPADSGVLLGTSFGLRIIGGVIAALCAAFSVWVLRPEDPALLLLVGIMSLRLVLWSFETFDFWFQSQLLSKYKVLTKNSTLVLYLLAVVTLVYWEASLVWFGAAMIAETVFYSAGLVSGYHVAKGPRGWRFSIDEARRLLHEGWPYLFSGIAIMVYMRIDQIMLGSLASDTAVGHYAVAARFSEGWYMVPKALAVSIFPSLVAAKAAGEDQYYNRLGKSFAVLSVTALSIAVAIMFFAVPLVTLLFGEAYAPASGILIVHVWSGVAVFMGYIAGIWVVIERHQNFMMYTTAMGAVLNIILNYWLIPLYGGLGAAMATLVSYSCTSVLAYGIYAPAGRLWRTMMRALFMPWSFFVGKGGAK